MKTAMLILCAILITGCCNLYDGKGNLIARSTGILKDVAYNDSVDVTYLLPVTVTNKSWITDSGIPIENVMQLKASRTFEAKSTTASLINSLSKLAGQVNSLNPL